uniref:Uncharacterized protein n=1 Tax=Porphyra crispata TaxID=671081 RepID=A0A8F8KPF8_9RHOD|nr:hypothetical protein [Porphyra crispata]
MILTKQPSFCKRKKTRTFTKYSILYMF